MPKSIPRGQATPRLIRDIKPKRQLPRSQIEIVDQSEEEWLQQAEENGDGADATNSANHDSFDTNNASGEYSGAIINDDVVQGSRFRSSLTWKRVCLIIWEWHKRTPKKLKQVFWSFILFRTLKLIYNMDLDNYSSSKWQAIETYDSVSSMSNQLSPVNVKPVGKSFFSNENLANKAELFGLSESSYHSELGLEKYASDTKSKNIIEKTAQAVKSAFALSGNKVEKTTDQRLGDISSIKRFTNF
jgi:hypothetical protein